MEDIRKRAFFHPQSSCVPPKPSTKLSDIGGGCKNRLQGHDRRGSVSREAVPIGRRRGRERGAAIGSVRRVSGFQRARKRFLESITGFEPEFVCATFKRCPSKSDPRCGARFPCKSHALPCNLKREWDVPSLATGPRREGSRYYSPTRWTSHVRRSASHTASPALARPGELSSLVNHTRSLVI